MRAYFADRGEERADTIITADTAHGTNPASVTMAGYKLEKVATTARGNVDLDDLRAKVNERTAALMLTNPSTLGLFDEGIEEVARDLPRRGRAPLLRRREPERGRAASRAPATWASTSSTTTCTRRSRSRTAAAARARGPVAVRETLEPFLPVADGRPRDGGRFRARATTGRGRSGGARLRRAVRRVRPLVRVHARLWARPEGDVRGGGAERELPARAAARRLRAARTTGSACTSSCSRRGS